MFSNPMTLAARSVLAAAGVLAVAACSEPVTSPTPVAAPSLSAVNFWEAGSSVSWNKTARDLIVARGVGTPTGQSRVMTYLSVAQYNAIVAAEDAKAGGGHASPAAAAAGASLVVLKSFFPLDAAMLDGKLTAQRSAEPWPGERTRDFAAGEAIGRAIGADVLEFAATDGIGLTAAPVNPGGPGRWTATNPVLGNYGARRFALTSADQFRPAPPPPYGSPEFAAALTEVRALTNPLSDDRRAGVLLWAPRGPAFMNSVAAEMIVAHRRPEREAARILALANMAGFDVLNACFDAKFAYYYIRPTQADPTVTLAIPLPNHPSYPSGHSCLTATYATVLQSAFPEEADRLAGMVEDAGLSRMHGGLHYLFDCTAGQLLGRKVAEQVLRTAPTGHRPIPLD